MKGGVVMLTRKNLKKLAESCRFSPEKIGIAILKLLGYKVETFIIDPAVYVYDSDGKLVYWRD